MFDRAKLKINAKEKIKGRVFSVFLGILIWIIATGISATAFTKNEGVTFVFNIIAFALSVLEIGVAGYMLKFIDDDKVDYNNIFISFKAVNIYFKHLGLIILRGIFIFLWSLLLIVPGIIKAISYSQSSYIMAQNPDMEIIDCIKASQRLMKGHKGEYFVMVLSFIGWGLLAAITLGIASIYVAPYYHTTLALYHRHLSPLLEPDDGVMTADEAFFASIDDSVDTLE